MFDVGYGVDNLVVYLFLNEVLEDSGEYRELLRGRDGVKYEEYLVYEDFMNRV